MKYNKFIGNIFVVERQLDVKTILETIVAAFFAATFFLIWNNESILTNFSVKWLVTAFVSPAAYLVCLKRKSIKSFFWEYFPRISIQTFIYHVIIYFTITILFILLDNTIHGYILSALFIISGFQRVIIQNTKALFFAEISEFMDFIQTYGYVRASYFALLMLLICIKMGVFMPYVFDFNIIILWIALFSVIFILEMQFMSNLYPYCKKHKDIENTILIIRKIAKNKHIKINKISSCVDASDDFINKQLRELVDANYISIENKRAKLKDEYKKTYADNL